MLSHAMLNTTLLCHLPYFLLSCLRNEGSGCVTCSVMYPAVLESSTPSIGVFSYYLMILPEWNRIRVLRAKWLGSKEEKAFFSGRNGWVGTIRESYMVSFHMVTKSPNTQTSITKGMKLWMRHRLGQVVATSLRFS